VGREPEIQRDSVLTEATVQTLSTTLRNAINAGKPQRVLLEFFKKPDGSSYSSVKQFGNEDIVISNGLRLDFDFNSETDLTIGLCPSAEIQFTMLNDAGQLNDFQFGTFRAYLGARIDSGTPASGAKTKTYTENGVSRLYEFSQLGVFIAQRPDVIKKLMIDVSANDLMTLFDVDMPSATAMNLTYPTTLDTLLTKMCTYVGVSRKSQTILNSSLAISKAPDEFDDATMRDVLKWIGEAACSIVRCNRSGQLELAWFNTVAKTYSEQNYSDFTPSWYETKPIDSLHVRNEDSTSESVTGTGSNAYLIVGNPFLKQS